MSVAETLQLMIGFGTFIVTLVGVMIAIVNLKDNKK